MSVAQNLNQVLKKIRGCGRADVRVLAVSKTHPVSKILEAYAEGQRLFGENFVQELLKKQEQLSSQKIEWHFIGRLQSNKVKQLVGKCRLIHSVDRLSLAQEISRRAVELGIVQSVLLQVNIANEESKGGVSVTDLPALAAAAANLPGLKVEGLMVMPPLSLSPNESRRLFAQTRELGVKLKIGPELSMGTSSDFDVAIAEGATLLRIGTEIFGARLREDGQ